MSTVQRADLKPIALRSMKTALLVGPVLTLINQWEAVIALQTPNLPKVLLTFLVPFCVSFYSGYAMRKSVAAQLCASHSVIDTLERKARACEKRAAEAEEELSRCQKTVLVQS